MQFTSFTKLWGFLSGMRIPMSEYVRGLSEIPWTRFDVTLIVLCVLAFLALIVHEVVSGIWTTLLTWITADERCSRCATILLSLVAGRYLFGPGYLTWMARHDLSPNN